MEETPIAVEINALNKSYGKNKKALADVSLTIELGKVCCLLGPNGSGKTTLLKILTGLMSPDSGDLSILGINPYEDPLTLKKLVGWMPSDERSGFYGRLTGRENLRFFSQLHQMSDERFKRVMGNIGLLLNLGDEIDIRILKVSSGERQKMGLARALLHDPQLLILDEPFRNLDPQTVVRFRRLLKDHLSRVQRKTILLSTHQLEEARRVADVIYILKDGKIIKRIEARELESEIRHSSIEEFYLELVRD